MTREEWLNKAVALLQDRVFTAVEVELPRVMVSVGFPGGGARVDRVIGQCWAAAATKGNISQVFINPSQDDAVRVLDVLAHELIHAWDDCRSGHRGEFARVARAVGLEGKLTATVAGTALTETLRGIAEELGEFPHSAMDIGQRRKQATRMMKVECLTTGYILRTTAKWLEMYGAPICPCCREEMSY